MTQVDFSKVLNATDSSVVTIDALLEYPWGRNFWIERKNGEYRMGDAVSHYAANKDFTHLTFDISNNKALANVGVQGALLYLTIYRDSYRSACHPTGWSGVWLAKDSNCFGPYSFGLEIDGTNHDLACVDWDFKTGLLDNIFPITELAGPDGRFAARLITFAPLSSNGAERPRGVVYGLHLTNTSHETLRGTVHAPKPFQRDMDKKEMTWAQFDPFDFEMGLGDSPAFQKQVPFSLAPGAALWVPYILYMPGEPTIEEINQKGTAAWLAETWRYHRTLLGRLETRGDSFLGEFYERQVLQAFQSIAFSGSGKMAGSNWGSYPSTRQIWLKDTYYSCLPLMKTDPLLAKNIILWFHEFGVRHPGVIVEGGVSHSISLSVASILLAGVYYDATADKAFFDNHPALKDSWGKLLDAIIASRREPEVWLFPTRFISDGALDCDYHTGSNICVWRAIKSYARLLREVYHDSKSAEGYDVIAEKVRAALLERTVIDGPLGRQFIEGTNRDGKAAHMICDGEESDTTLMPFYGLLPYDDAVYLNTMRYSMSPDNLIYYPEVRSISWACEPVSPLDKRVPSTTPSFNRGLCIGADKESLFGETGYFTEMRRVADADGSIWWWPYNDASAKPEYGKVTRGVPGKAGWTSGVFATLLPSRFLGVSYDAMAGVLHFAPLAATGNFVWTDFPQGNHRFSIRYETASNRVSVQIENLNAQAIRLEAALPVSGGQPPCEVFVDAALFDKFRMSKYMGQNMVHVTVDIPAQTAASIQIKK